jgi:glycosyltransferase involved in cell wall biosynthesis
MSDRAERALRIGVLVRSLGGFRGGVDVYVRELTAALIDVAHESGHRLHVFADEPAIAAEFAAAGAETAVVRPDRFGRLSWDHWKAPLACARAGIDVTVNLRSFRSLVVAGRSVSILYDMSYHDIPSQLPWWDSAYFRMLHRLSLARSDGIVVFSGFTRDRLLANLPAIGAERITVASPGPPDPAFQPIAEPVVRETLARFGVEAPYVVAVGAQPRKNIDTILEAISKVDDADRMGLVVVSKWQDEAHVRSLRALADRCGVGTRFVVISGCPNADLAALYCGATALVYVSSYEGIGIPPFEAMAAGCPVIVSTAASLPEVVGDAAALVPPRDVAALRDAIARVRDDVAYASQLRSLGAAHVRDFNWRRSAREVLAAVERSVRPPAAGRYRAPTHP